MKKALIFAAVIILGAWGAWQIASHSEEIHAEVFGEQPLWLESDSAAAIDSRTRADFSLSRAEMLAAVREQHPEVDEAMLDTFVAHHYVEALTFDGEQRFHRKSPRNLNLLNPDYRGKARRRGDSASPKRISYVDSVLQYYRGTNPEGLAHSVTFRFSIDVPGNEALQGDTLRVWMPLPLGSPEGRRQSDVQILDAYPSDYILSDGRSMHNSIYFSAPAAALGDTAHFEYVCRFITRGAWRSSEDIESALKPYDKSSQTYTRYTRVPDGPHIIRLDSLARAIVGDETNPFRQSEMVFDYIIERYPWAGAREYSTIPCMPEYVLAEGHGDCGQVSLLYISLMRSLGVPARWESGWMLHPGEVNLHDWAEVYFEGIGWLPVDVSFGRYTTSPDKLVQGFYSHGIDAHRFAANTGVSGDFYPPKKYVRSETVDFQLGEVESSRGNLFYPAWSLRMQPIEIKPIAQ